MTIDIKEIVLNESRHVTLAAMIQSVCGEFGQISKRPAVIILPGGGYSMCSDREAETVAYPYLQAGYHAFVLRYSVGEYRTWPAPLDDYDKAMELIRSKAVEWNVIPDKIAVIGFSAGGHLAACAATMAVNRPNAAILGYAAMEKEIVEACQTGASTPIPKEHIDQRTCPCFLFAARDDIIVPVRNTIRFEDALIDHGITFESHIYAYGGHGFGTGEPSIIGTSICKRIPHWVRDSIGWLEDLFGQLSLDGLSDPVCKAKINGNWDDALSSACTIKHLKNQKGTAEQILSETFALIDQVVKGMFGEKAVAGEVLAEITLQDVLKMIGQPQDAIAQLDAALMQIPNLK